MVSILPYLDTIKSLCYLGIGIFVGYAFWNICERRNKRGLNSINPLLFLLMVCWGASGFFFLSPLLHVLPDSLNLTFRFFITPFPDWDIPLYILTDSLSPQEYNWEFLKHRSWLFSSNLIPFFLIGVSIFTPVIRSLKYRFRIFLDILYDIGIGLAIGVSSHLFSDIALSFIKRGDTGFEIYRWSLQSSFVWLMVNIILGMSVPFLLISASGVNKARKAKHVGRV